MKEKQIVKCFCARESAAPASDEAKLVNEVTSKAGWQREREKTRGLWGKAQEENTCPQTLQGVQHTGNGQELKEGRRKGGGEEDKKMRRGNWKREQ